MAIWVDPNDIHVGLTVDSGTELKKSESIHFHYIKWSTMFTNETKLQQLMHWV